MGREVRRVAEGFDWPVGKVWEGFQMPERLLGQPCEPCGGSGQTHAGWWLQRIAQRITMLVEDVRDRENGRPMHPWLARDVYPHGHWENGSYEVDRPSSDIRELVDGLIGEKPGPFGYMGQDYKIFGAIVKAAGLEKWGGCDVCGGHGSVEAYPGQRADAEAWEPTDPPAGDHWQLWETVSEGSPVSPVFATAEELARWLSRDGGDFDASLAWVTGPGWAPSMYLTGGRVVTADDVAKGVAD